jgi:hypothetical protein
VAQVTRAMVRPSLQSLCHVAGRCADIVDYNIDATRSVVSSVLRAMSLRADMTSIVGPIHNGRRTAESANVACPARPR